MWSLDRFTCKKLFINGSCFFFYLSTVFGFYTHLCYGPDRSVDDILSIGLHFILQHFDSSGTFNTIIPDILHFNLSQLTVPTLICNWIIRSPKDSKVWRTHIKKKRKKKKKQKKKKQTNENTGRKHSRGCTLSIYCVSSCLSLCTYSGLWDMSSLTLHKTENNSDIWLKFTGSCTSLIWHDSKCFHVCDVTFNC